MRLNVEKDEIQKALQNVQGIVAKKNTMPVLSHFLLSVSGGRADIIATDLEIAIKEPLKAEVLSDGSLCIPARELFEITKEVEGDLLLESLENNWLKVSSGQSIFKLVGLPEGEYPSLPEVSQAEKLDLAVDVLSNMIEKTIYAAGDSTARYVMNGLFLHFIPREKGIELKMVGTDGHRLSLSTVESEGKLSVEKKLILPKKAALELRRLLSAVEGAVTIGIDKNHIFFTLGDILFISRLIEGNYPNYEQVIPQANERIVTLDKSGFLKALKRASIVSRERTNAVRLDIEGSKLTIISINPDLGEAKEEMVVQYKGEPISIGFNARYLMDVLQVMEGEAARLELQDTLSPSLLKEGEDKGYRCVVMPMRI
ncbi:MAG TPA: DNA polymerase III subunit beta [Nitrospiraceae bacterium]|nr:DNA polymerase III subunit beta [Nitrospiraceae bacterium]